MPEGLNGLSAKQLGQMDSEIRGVACRTASGDPLLPLQVNETGHSVIGSWPSASALRHTRHCFIELHHCRTQLACSHVPVGHQNALPSGRSCSKGIDRIEYNVPSG